MGNNEIKEDDIITWLEEGWRFRKKQSRGRNYITRRKQKKEKSLGPYDQELWDAIQNLSQREGFKKTTKNNNFQIQINQITKLLIRDRDYNVIGSCIFMNDESYCRYFTYWDKTEAMKMLDEMDMSDGYALIDIDINGKNEKKYSYVGTRQCKNCLTFLNEKMVEAILNYDKKN
jgi:hypothetical protein